MQNVWITTIPLKDQRADVVLESLREPVESYNRTNGRISKFIIPSLVIGTLDSLMSLSDDLVKVNGQIENVVKKIERQYLDIGIAEKKDTGYKSIQKSLTINNKPVEDYIRKFEWDYARYPMQNRPLIELTNQITAMTARVDEELKKISTIHNDKTANLSALMRRRVVNFITSDFEDFLTLRDISNAEFIDSDNLLTVVVVVPKQFESEFLRTYSSNIGDNIAIYGETKGKIGVSSGRDQQKGSPVVPDSAVKIKEEGEQVLYSMVVLKGHTFSGYYDVDGNFNTGNYIDYIEPLKTAFKEKRFTVREYSYDPTRTGGLEDQITNAQRELKISVERISNWCETNFGEVYAGLIHLKIIRAFVESVLRYSLPVNILAVFIEPNMSKEKKIISILTNTITKICPELVIRKFDNDVEEEEDEDFDNLPFVCQKFTCIGGK